MSSVVLKLVTFLPQSDSGRPLDRAPVIATIRGAVLIAVQFFATANHCFGYELEILAIAAFRPRVSRVDIEGPQNAQARWANLPFAWIGWNPDPSRLQLRSNAPSSRSSSNGCRACHE
jgi:hypothetical protein